MVFVKCSFTKDSHLSCFGEVHLFQVFGSGSLCDVNLFQSFGSGSFLVVPFQVPF